LLNQQAMPEAGKPAQQTAGKRSRKDKMKGSIGVTDNDWFAFLFKAAIFTKNSPPVRHTTGG
jgi:hypothetical protein